MSAFVNWLSSLFRRPRNVDIDSTSLTFALKAAGYQASPKMLKRRAKALRYVRANR